MPKRTLRIDHANARHLLGVLADSVWRVNGMEELGCVTPSVLKEDANTAGLASARKSEGGVSWLSLNPTHMDVGEVGHAVVSFRT